IVVFGRTGAGVSSLVNLVAGSAVAQCHADTRPCTQRAMSYAATFAGKQFCIYDIPGYRGHSPDAEITGIIQDIENERGIDVLVYCLRRKRDTMMPDVFREIRRVVPRDVPVVAVVTELERQEGTMESWWTTSSEAGKVGNGEALGKMGMTFEEHACVTTLSPEDVMRNEGFSERRSRSQEAVRRILAGQCTEVKRNPMPNGIE
ncbi:hypothetical protein J3A83DRAFT_4085601, partial [Scleroderma citrinum]